MELTSSAFKDQATIPPKYTCDGLGVNPPLAIADVPAEAQSLVLIMEDPDVPREVKPDGLFVHWVLFDIPPSARGIPEDDTAIGTRGMSDSGKSEYSGPCPPPLYEPPEHRYFFRLYALDTRLALEPGATKDEVESAMEGHVIAMAELMGRYRRD